MPENHENKISEIIEMTGGVRTRAVIKSIGTVKNGTKMLLRGIVLDGEAHLRVDDLIVSETPVILIIIPTGEGSLFK